MRWDERLLELAWARPSSKDDLTRQRYLNRRQGNLKTWDDLLPSRNVLRSIFLDWANLRAVIAGIGSGPYCSNTPSFRALQEAPCEALNRFAHVWSETLQKGAKPLWTFELSTVTVNVANWQQCDSNGRSHSNCGKSPQQLWELSTRPTRQLNMTTNLRYLSTGTARDDHEF